MRGVIKIRYTRGHKYAKKNWKFIVSTQILITCYLITLGTGFLTSNTEAYFSDNSIVNGKFEIGSWQEQWDKSSLMFPNEDDQYFEISNPQEISVSITNIGSNMAGSTLYEIYYISKGNPKNGEKISEGLIEPISANGTTFIKFTANEPGNYKIRSYQRPFHAHKTERQDLWSETIIIAIKNNENINEQGYINQNTNQPAIENMDEIEQPTLEHTNENSIIENVEPIQIDNSQVLVEVEDALEKSQQ